jgi:hypothetical protein
VAARASGGTRTAYRGAPEIFFKPPYVGVRGWVGIELANISDKDLASYLQEAWMLIAPKRLHKSVEAIQLSTL